MDRNEILRACVCGMCTCAAACFSSPLKASAAQASDDWRMPFVKERYAKLLNIISDKMGSEELTEVLHQVGGYCASTFGDAPKKYRGDVDGFIEFIKSDGSGREERRR